MKNIVNVLKNNHEKGITKIQIIKKQHLRELRNVTMKMQNIERQQYKEQKSVTVD